MKKKTFILTLFTTVLLSQAIANFFALNDSLIVFGNSDAKPFIFVSPATYVATELDETFTIELNISNVENLHAFECKLGYNTTLLDVTQVALGSFFEAPPSALTIDLETDETAGLVYANIAYSNPEAAKSGSGTLATVTFTVTYASSLPSRTWCPLNLHDSILYDVSMTQISHENVDGLYFWKTILDDPSGTGLIFDLTTQKGGIGSNVTDGTYTLLEVVQLIGHLTYDGQAVQQKLVSFEVRNPQNEIVLQRVAITDSNGYAIIDFRIPNLPTSIGTWTATALASVTGQIVWDWTSFKVLAPSVGGYATFMKQETASALQIDIYTVILTITVFSTVIATKRHRIAKISLKH